MTPAVITIIAVFLGTATLCAGVGFAWFARSEDPLRRLDRLNCTIKPVDDSHSILKKELLEEGAAGLAEIWTRVGIRPDDIATWFRQAELPIKARWLLIPSALLSLALIAGATRLHAPPIIYPVVGLVGAAIPLAYVQIRRKRLQARFSEQLPDALELMASALRSGNTIQASMSVIAQELMPPVSREFGAVSESIRLGISVEQALDDLSARVANPDLQFFVTAVAMQRQCGGDLAEILDKISWLVRERFHIQGQVQALTGEGRMSGAVLLALPVLLFFVVYTLNPTYVMLLFTEPMGKKMLAGAVLMQICGAIVIRRIINIKI